MWLTAAMMIVEIIAGTVLGSMALLADGWHMSSHALALGVSAGAYALARRHAHDARFAFGTWKIEVLGGYTSAVVLLGVAAYMGIESVSRLLQPAPIHFRYCRVHRACLKKVNVIPTLPLSEHLRTGSSHWTHATTSHPCVSA